MRLVRAAAAATATTVVTTAAVGAFLLAGCRREERRFTEKPPSSNAQDVKLPTIEPGAAVISVSTQGPYDNNAYAISQGKRLFNAMNCSGCHFHGGGGIGPPLMDDQWIYGGDPAQVFSTIVQGRPNGMPSFAGKLSTQQVWQLVAYVRSMSGHGQKAARSGRNDEMMVIQSEQRARSTGTKATFAPPSTQRP